jgi:hypothetical protein
LHPVSSTDKTDRHDIAEILLKVALNTTIPNPELIHSLLLEEVTTNHLSLLVFTDPQVVTKIKLNKSALRYRN